MQKSITLLSMCILVIFSFRAISQNVGIGTTTPQAFFNVAANRTVLFGLDTTTAGAKFIWYPSKGALRFGRLDPVFSTTAWNYANVGVNSLAFGSSTLASGPQSIASGTATTSTGFYSWAHGFVCTAGGDHSLAFGQSVTATGIRAYAFGESLNALNSYTFTTGYGNTANGSNSTVFGSNNHAKAYGSFVIGRYNDSMISSSNSSWITADPVFIIGNGIGVSSRSNAFTVLKDGTTGINKIPANALNTDAMLEVRSTGPGRDAFSIEGSSGNKWAFYTFSNLGLFYNDVHKGFFNAGDGVYTPVSDARFKKDVKQLDPVLSGVLKLKPYSYHFLDNPPNSKPSHGFLAQEVEKIFPEMVSTTTGREGEKIYGLNYNNFAVLAIKAIQEQQQIIDNQNKKLDALEKKLLAIEESLLKITAQ